ncbi:HSP70/90 co-chaperone, partial [Porites harrisoni]
MMQSGNRAASESDVTSLSNEHALDFDDETLIAIAQVYNNEGTEAFLKRDYSNAVYFFTEGIKVNCKDEDCMAMLYSNRASANLHEGNYIYSLVDAKNATDIRPLSIEPIIAGAYASAELNLLDLAIDWCAQGLMIDEENTGLINLILTCAETRAKDNK